MVKYFVTAFLIYFTIDFFLISSYNSEASAVRAVVLTGVAFLLFHIHRYIRNRKLAAHPYRYRRQKSWM